MTAWYIDDDNAPTFFPKVLGHVLFFSFPGWVLLFAGPSGYFFSIPATAGLAVAALGFSARVHIRHRAAVRKMELSPDGRQLTLSLVNGKEVTFDVADAET